MGRRPLPPPVPALDQLWRHNTGGSLWLVISVEEAGVSLQMHARADGSEPVLARPNFVKASRFNGKRYAGNNSGYSFVRDLRAGELDRPAKRKSKLRIL